MRTEQLDYLAAVTRLGSLRLAAQELHMTQPALSETLRNLEKELGVTLLERRRSGATLSDEGRELMPLVTEVLDAVDRLRRAADHQHSVSRMVRLGTVNAATVPLLVPAIEEFRRKRPETQVEVIPAQQAQIHRALLDGSFDMGLVNLLEGDDDPHDLATTPLLRGDVVVCMRHDDPLAAKESITREDLAERPLVVMRAGYLMHRFVHRLFDGQVPGFSYSTDGAEMGKLMVAEGLGVTLLPDYSVLGDPLERCGLLTARPLAAPRTRVRLVLQSRLAGSMPTAMRDLRQALVDRAARYEAGHAGAAPVERPACG
ncbi:LysR family transcriptional regulator [Kitasatospora sp. NPDC057223]|uniref:LysR family transcriptional regulator n=1 Tax=Kitasatospora sp. NPDC057223 TaxID=3346055 RepID=UPI0036287BC1